MKRKYYKLADSLGDCRRWRLLDVPPLVMFTACIVAGYEREELTLDIGVLLVFLLVVSVLVCNPFHLLDWALAPASRYSLSVGGTMIYAAVRIPEYPPYCIFVTVALGAVGLVMGIVFRKRWLEGWRKREEKRAYQLSIYQCEAVDNAIGQLKADSETAALDAWNAYGNSQCRALLHQWANIEITEDEIDTVVFPVWILTYGSAYSDRAEMVQKVERSETEEKNTKLWLRQANDKIHELEKNLRNNNEHSDELFQQYTKYQDEVRRLKQDNEELRLLLAEAMEEPEELTEDIPGVIRMQPRFQPKPEDVPEDVEEPEVTEPVQTPTFFIAGVPADGLTEEERRELGVLEYYEQGHSQQECAEAFDIRSRRDNQISRKSAENIIRKAKTLRERLLAEQEAKAVNA